jgi:hypothetical protein
MGICRRDATLRELATLIQHVNAAARQPDCQLHFRAVYFNRRLGHYVCQDMGKIYGLPKVGHLYHHTNDENRRLDDVRFEIGNYLDVAIIRQRQALEPASSSAHGRGVRRPSAIRSHRFQDQRRTVYSRR